MILSFKKMIHLASIATVCIAPIASHAQNFYKWTDASGSTHYTTTPPPKQKGIASQGVVKTYNSPYTQSSDSNASNNNNAYVPNDPHVPAPMPMTQPIPENSGDEPELPPR